MNLYKYSKQDLNAKTLSFNMLEENASFNNEMLNELKILLKSNPTCRISLHTDVNKDLHNMIIGMRKGNYVFPHKHLKSETYHIMEGEAILSLFDEEGRVISNTFLSPEKTLISRVDKERYHSLIPISDFVIFNETRLGPFISNSDSIFASWVGENKEEYMQNLINKMDIKC